MVLYNIGTHTLTNLSALLLQLNNGPLCRYVDLNIVPIAIDDLGADLGVQAAPYPGSAGIIGARRANPSF